jgi:hypothetical protein
VKRHTIALSLLFFATLALSCAAFAEKELPAFTGLKVTQMSGPAGGPIRAVELSCRADQHDYDVTGMGMTLEFHDCNTNPVQTREGRSFLEDPMIIGESLRPDADFAPHVHSFVHAFHIGQGAVDPRACVTFRCAVKYTGPDGPTTAESRFCRGSVAQQRICSGGGRR